MTGWIGDAAVAHLRDVADWPDLGDRYEIRGRIGSGGMGVVYAARDRTLERDVAIKVLDALPPLAETGPHRLGEARIIGGLEHPGIVPVHDAGVLADGRAFYVMKLVRGDRLDTVVEQRSLNERLDLFLRVCDTVAFAHAHGVVHRDLKPQNIMIGPFGEVLVMDWGVAVATEAQEAMPVAGTPGFMAPEQTLPGSAVDARTDVFALGVLLDAMLPRPVPKALAAIASRASAHRPADRYGQVQDLARDVSRFREGEPVSAYRESPGERLARIYARHRVPIVLVLVYMVIRVILLLWLRT